MTIISIVDDDRIVREAMGTSSNRSDIAGAMPEVVTFGLLELDGR
jgi:hypothetical protein